MSGNFIITTPKSDMHALAYQGIMVTDSYPQIRDMLRHKPELGDEYVLLFAEPVPNPANNSIDWYTPVQGAARPLSELPVEEQNVLRDRLAQMAGEILRYADELKKSQTGSGLTRGNILALALSYPGEEALFVVGDQPVFTCWGHGPGTPGAEPQDLSRLARLAVVAPPAPEPVKPAPEAVFVPAPEPTAAVQEPVAPAAERKGRGAGCLLWLLPLLLLLLLLLLPFIGIGGVPAISGRTLYNIPWRAAESAPGLAELRAQNDRLEREVAALAAQARTHADRCRESAPPVMERPAATPVPPAAKPEEVASPVPAPEEEKGEELVIPDQPEEVPGKLTFLRGRWLCETGLVNGSTGEPVVVEFVFDDEGRGLAVVHERNDRCTGRAIARFAEGNLHIDIDEQTCARSEGYSAQRIDCRNNGPAAECRGANQSESGESWEARFFRLAE